MTIERHTDDLAALSLDELASELRAACGRFEEAVYRTVMEAVHAGALLEAARRHVGEGLWYDWLDSHFPYTTGTAAHWMRLAHFYADPDHRDKIESADSIRSALDALKGLPPVRSGNFGGGPESKYPEWIAAEAKRLVFEEGLSRSAVAEKFGTSLTMVEYWLDPGRVLKRNREGAKRRRAERRALKEKQKRDALQQAAKAAGLGELYSLFRQLYQQHARAVEDGDTHQATLTRMRALLDKYESMLVAAIGVE